MEKEWIFKTMENNEIDGVKFADDKTLFSNIQTPEHWRQILQTFEDYEKVSGLKININKTQILPINTRTDIIEQIDPDKLIMKDEITILGIKFKKTIEETLEANKQDLKERIRNIGERMKGRNYPILKKGKLMQSRPNSQIIYRM